LQIHLIIYLEILNQEF